ncbi:unnamed protein product [Echinostoma caproni]|uniref:WH2 domain-containing protein n=1 Tax=Echinostoma caproni TaxID=27848 RepID=A0A183AJQ8_9TREM|nr:unnamed protein product [Echinostoma caproni]
MLGSGKRSLAQKLKHKLSKSTHNITIAAAKKAGGEKIYGDSRHSVLSASSSKMNQQYPDSSTMGLNQVPSGSVLSLSRDNYPIEGGTRTSGGDQLYNMNTTGPTGTNLLGTGNIGGGVGGGSLSTLQNSPYTGRSSDVYGLSRPDGAIDDSLVKLHGSQASGIDAGGWGLHAEERPKKRMEGIF